MGRIIGGVFVGFISMFIASGILAIILAFVVGAEGIINVETKEPQSMWIVVLLVVGAAAAFTGGAIGRLIGKSPNAAYGLMILVVALSSFAFFGGDPSAEQLAALEQADMSAFIAISYAQMNSPQYLMFLSPLVSLVGIAVGGLKMADFSSDSSSDEANNDRPPV